MPKPPKRGQPLQVRLSVEQRTLFEKYAAMLPADLSTFCRMAMNEKVARMKTEQKKL